MKCRYALIGATMAGILAPAGQAANIVETAQQAGTFTTLLAASKAAGADKLLQGKGPFTVFAPNDAAFAKVPADKRTMLMAPANRKMLKQVLGTHVVFGRLSEAEILKGLGKAEAVSVSATNNMPLVFKREGGGLTVNGAKIVGHAMRVDNGIVFSVAEWIFGESRAEAGLRRQHDRNASSPAPMEA